MVMSGMPFHIRLPAAASHIITPTENTSARRSTRSPRACSGAMYDTLPLSTPLRGLLVRRVQGLGDAEVHHLDLPVVGDEHVVGRDVAVDHVEVGAVVVGELVRVVQARERVAEDLEVEREREAAALLEAVEDAVERLALQVLHGDEVVLALLPDLVGWTTWGLAQPGDEARLVEEHAQEHQDPRPELGPDLLDHGSLLKPAGPPTTARKTSPMPPWPSSAMRRYLPRLVAAPLPPAPILAPLHAQALRLAPGRARRLQQAGRRTGRPENALPGHGFQHQSFPPRAIPAWPAWRMRACGHAEVRATIARQFAPRLGRRGGAGQPDAKRRHGNGETSASSPLLPGRCSRSCPSPFTDRGARGPHHRALVIAVLGISQLQATGDDAATLRADALSAALAARLGVTAPEDRAELLGRAARQLGRRDPPRRSRRTEDVVNARASRSPRARTCSASSSPPTAQTQHRARPRALRRAGAFPGAAAAGPPPRWSPSWPRPARRRAPSRLGQRRGGADRAAILGIAVTVSLSYTKAARDDVELTCGARIVDMARPESGPAGEASHPCIRSRSTRSWRAHRRPSTCWWRASPRPSAATAPTCARRAEARASARPSSPC